MFNLNRFCELQSTNRTFALRDMPEENPDFNGYFTEEIEAVILFDSSVKYRLIEEYSPDCYMALSCALNFPLRTRSIYLSGWDKAELLEPMELRAEVKTRLENSLNKYLE